MKEEVNNVPDTKVDLPSTGFERLMYKTSETPPVHLLLFFAFQVIGLFFSLLTAILQINYVQFI